MRPIAFNQILFLSNEFFKVVNESEGKCLVHHTPLFTSKMILLEVVLQIQNIVRGHGHTVVEVRSIDRGKT